MGAKKKGTEILSALNLCSVDPWPKVTRLHMNLMSQASKLQNNSHSIWAKEAEGGMTTDHVSRDGTTSLFHIPPTTYLIFTVSGEEFTENGPVVRKTTIEIDNGVKSCTDGLS